MAITRSVLPLRRDGPARILPWLVAVMAYVAAVVGGAVLATEFWVADWQQRVLAAVTVEVPPGPDGDRRAVAVATALAAVPGVSAAEAMPREAIARLLEPWLGGGGAIEAVPLPRLVDVRVDPAAPPTTAALVAAVRPLGDDLVVDDHRAWLGRLIRVSNLARLAGTGMLVLVTLGTALTIVMATRAMLAIHRDVIEILHVIGATDGFIARLIQRQAFGLGLIGAAGGAALGFATLVAVSLALVELGGTIPGERASAIIAAAVLVALPLAAALLALVTARLVAILALRRMV